MKSLERHEIVKSVVEMFGTFLLLKTELCRNCREFWVDFEMQFEVLSTNLNIILGSDTKDKKKHPLFKNNHWHSETTPVAFSYLYIISVLCELVITNQSYL